MPLSLHTLRALFAHSGNRCAFPGCDQELVTSDCLFVGQICHIEASSPEGPRHNAAQSQAERDGPANLLLLCYAHHRRVDTDPGKYTVPLLQKVKEDSKDRTHGATFEMQQSLLESVLRETNLFWSRLRLVQKVSRQEHEFPMELDLDIPHGDSIDELLTILDEVHRLVERVATEGHIAETGPTQWEASSIYIPNLLALARLHLRRVEVHMLESDHAIHPANEALTVRLELARAALAQLTQKSRYVD